MSATDAYATIMRDLRATFRAGSTRSLEWRIRQLEGLLTMYTENSQAFASALYKDLRKPIVEAMGTEIDFLKNDVIGKKSQLVDNRTIKDFPIIYIRLPTRHPFMGQAKINSSNGVNLDGQDGSASRTVRRRPHHGRMELPAALNLGSPGGRLSCGKLCRDQTPRDGPSHSHYH